MVYRIMLHIDVDARDDNQALDHAKKIGDLLKNPMVKMVVEGDGVRIVGQPQIYQPQRPGEFG